MAASASNVSQSLPVSGGWWRGSVAVCCLERCSRLPGKFSSCISRRSRTAHKLLLAKLSRSNKDNNWGRQNLADHFVVPRTRHAIDGDGIFWAGPGRWGSSVGGETREKRLRTDGQGLGKTVPRKTRSGIGLRQWQMGCSWVFWCWDAKAGVLGGWLKIKKR